MTTSIQTMQSNEFLRSSTSPLVRPPHLLPSDLQSQLSMLYALTQQSMSTASASASPSETSLESKLKRMKKPMPTSNESPSQVPLLGATDSRSSSTSERELVKVVTTAGPQCVDKEFLNHLLSRKDVIPARKRRDFIPNELKDDHYWERRRKNNLAAKRSREKRRLNDIVLETKVVELTNENEALKAKLNLMLSRLNMKEVDMERLFEEEQRLGHISLKPATSAATILNQRSGTSDEDDDPHPPTQVPRPTLPILNETSEINDDEHVSTTIDDPNNARVQHPLLYNQLLGNNNDNSNNTGGAMDLTRTDMKVGNLLTTVPEKSPSPLTPSPSPPNESLLQILANQILKTKPQETVTSTTSARLLTIASPPESKSKRTFNQMQEDTDKQEQDQQQRKWNEAAMTLLSLNKPTPPAPVVEQQKALQSVCQSVINGLLRKPSASRATIDYHSTHSLHHQQMQGENFHQQSLAQLKTLMNYFSNASSHSFAIAPSSTFPPESTHAPSEPAAPAPAPAPEPRGDMMPLKLRMKMLNAKN